MPRSVTEPLVRTSLYPENSEASLTAEGYWAEIQVGRRVQVTAKPAGTGFPSENT